MSSGELIVVAFLALVILMAGVAMFFQCLWRVVPAGRALVLHKLEAEPTVIFTNGALVLPIVHRAEVMDISLKTIHVDRRGKQGIPCKDHIRADIRMTFFVRVNNTVDDVRKVAQAIGCERASHQETLDNLFSAKFFEALKTAAASLDFEELYTHREELRDDIVDRIANDLGGYFLEYATVDYLERTPVEALDPQNIFDAEAIRKITDPTTRRHVTERKPELVDPEALLQEEASAEAPRS